MTLLKITQVELNYLTDHTKVQEKCNLISLIEAKFSIFSIKLQEIMSAPPMCSVSQRTLKNVIFI